MTQRICTADGCRNGIPKERGNAAKYCNDHRYCLIDGCERAMHAGGFCRMHGARIGRTGSPGGLKPERLGSGDVLKELEELSTCETDFCVYPTSRAKLKIDGRQMTISRGMWYILHGDPGSAGVLHTCGNGHRACVNPRHLYLGDARTNARDRDIRDNRSPGGKITHDDATCIRNRCESGTSIEELASQFGITKNTVYRIVTYRSWNPDNLPVRNLKFNRLTTGQKIEIKARSKAGETDLSIASDFGVWPSTIHKIRR